MKKRPLDPVQSGPLSARGFFRGNLRKAGKAPKAGEACTGDLGCAYAETKCACAGPPDKGHWDCKRTAEACPEDAPTAGAACTLAPAQICPYPGDVQCACAATGWICATVICLAARPADLTECGEQTTPKFTCEYTEGNCQCAKGTWHCPAHRG